MSDIAELIEALRFQGECCPQETCHKCKCFNNGKAATPLPCMASEILANKAADAIEKIQKERDTAVELINELDEYVEVAEPYFSCKALIAKWRGEKKERDG